MRALLDDCDLRSVCQGAAVRKLDKISIRAWSFGHPMSAGRGRPRSADFCASPKPSPLDFTLAIFLAVI